ncbi:MAG: hypothetical protein HW377_2620 [Actinobacteria bacterium]|nr:hypothetical protein [Actinomycetota bacterium]MBM2828788.1 hypothetical protein [Actinomycetota bacterium]
MMVYNILKFLHILSVVFMSAPLYNLIVVNERVLFGKAPFAVDRYFENIIKGAATRCYVYQLSALVTGILLLPAGGAPLATLLENHVLAVKMMLLLVLTSLLSLVHFRIQPAIEKLLATVKGDEIPAEIAGEIAPLRLRRKRLAALCLFIVMTLVLLGLQISGWFGLPANALLFALAALFSYRVYKTPVRFGWI